MLFGLINEDRKFIMKKFIRVFTFAIKIGFTWSLFNRLENFSKKVEKSIKEKGW